MRGYLLLVLLFAGCDSRAKATDTGTRSKEYESCASTSDCDGELHCFDNACRRLTRSTVGDYYAAKGVTLRAKGDLEGALAAFNKATVLYDADKVAVPPDLDCSYGSALAQSKGNKANGELGAKLLHRCVLAIPGGALRERALLDLVTLEDAGLDPVTLRKTSTGDQYLTGQAAPPPAPTDKTVTIEIKPAAQGTQPIVDKLSAADLHAPFVACAAKGPITVSVPVKNTYYPSQYDDEAGGFAFKVDPAKAGAPAEETCVRAIVEPALKGVAIGTAFSTSVVITVK